MDPSVVRTHLKRERHRPKQPSWPDPATARRHHTAWSGPTPSGTVKPTLITEAPHRLTQRRCLLPHASFFNSERREVPAIHSPIRILKGRVGSPESHPSSGPGQDRKRVG